MSERTTQITVQTESRDLPPLILEVRFDFEPGCKEQGPSYASGGEPAVAPHVIVNAVECLGFDDSEDNQGGFDAKKQPLLAKMLGELCWAAFKEEIEEKVFAAFSEEEAERELSYREQG